MMVKYFKNKDILFLMSSTFLILIILFSVSFSLFEKSVNDKADGIESIQSEKEELMERTRIGDLSNKDNTLKESFNALEKQIAEGYFNNIRLPFSKDTSQEEQLKVWDKLDNDTKTYIVVKSIYDDKKVPDKYIEEVNNILKNNGKEKEEEIKKLTKKQKEERKELKEYIRKMEIESKGFFYIKKDSNRYHVLPTRKAVYWIVFSTVLFISIEFFSPKEKREVYYVFKRGE